MAATAASLFLGTIPRDTTPFPVQKKFLSIRIPTVAPRFAVSVDRPQAAATSPEKINPVVKREEEGRGGAVATKEEEEEREKRSVLSGLKVFLEEAKVMIDGEGGGGGAPRWFTPPLECGGSSRMEKSPLLLYLPG